MPRTPNPRVIALPSFPSPVGPVQVAVRYRLRHYELTLTVRGTPPAVTTLHIVNTPRFCPATLSALAEWQRPRLPEVARAFAHHCRTVGACDPTLPNHSHPASNIEPGRPKIHS
jgi:hypothetical protein